MIDRTYFIDRAELHKVFSPKAARQFEEMQLDQAAIESNVLSTVEATQALRDATFLTLSPNGELPNERVLTLGEGLAFKVNGDEARLDTTGLVKAAGGHEIRFVAAGDSEVLVPLIGSLSTLDGQERLTNKEVSAPRITDLQDALDDAGAAAVGVPVGGIYRNGSNLQVRVA